MALTYLPTAQTQQPSQQGYSDASIKMLRDYAAALKQEQESKNPYYTWANGLADVTKNLYGDHYLRQANALERGTLNTRGTSLGSGGISGQPQTPAVSNGSGSGGAGAAAPFPQGFQAGSVPSGGKDSNSRPTHTAMLEGEGNTEAPATAAMRLSSKGETGKDGMAALFNISKDTGGSKSYGPLGLNSKTGSAASFAKDHPELGLTAEPGTSEFDAQWRKVAATKSDDLQGAHTDWHQKNIMRGLTESMVKAGVNPAIATDPRVQTYMADRKVQMGQAGLAHALAYAKEAGSPEEFLKSVHQVDKARTPFNFPTYLKDNPNNIQGLHNRDDLRLTTALSGADPDLAKKMVDFHKNTQLAQNGSGLPQGVGQNTPLPQGQLQGEMGQLVRNLMVGGQMTAPQAMEAAEQALKLRGLTMPQFGAPNELGMGYKTEPGRMPAPYLTPGFPGKLGSDPNSGLPTIQRINPQTGQPETIIQFPQFQGGGPQSSVAPTVAPNKTVPAPPTGAVAQTPTVPIPTPRPASASPAGAPAGGLLATTPPGGATPATPTPQGVQVASAEAGTAPFQMAFDSITNKNRVPSNQQVAQAEAVAGAAKPENWMPYVEEANRMPEIGSSYVAPNLRKLYTDASSNPDPSVRAKAQDTLMDLKSAKAANLKKAEQTDAESGKRIAEVDKAISEGGIQGIKLQPSLKLANKIIKDEGFESGRLAGPITAGRNILGELKRINERFKNPDGSLEYPGIGKLIDAVGAGKASPNEAFIKVISASVLQSLRSMLGPNSGQFRVQELKLLEAAYGNENLSIEGNKIVMDMIDRMNDRSIVYNKMATAYRQNHGNSIDPNFEAAMDKYAEAHPTFNPDEYDKLLGIFQGDSKSEKTPPSTQSGPLGTPPPATPKKEYKLPPGFRIE